MTIIAVDDEKLALEALGDAIKEAEPTAQVFQFILPEKTNAG